MIKILCVGKLKEKYLVDLVSDYQNRISKYHPIEIIEVKDSNIVEEKNNLMKYISDKDEVITLEIDGESMSSEKFASRMEKEFIYHSNITFVIGGSLGLHEEIKKRSNLAISFSHMTFPHGLFRGILLEQIYRSFKIRNHESYHK